MNKRVRTALNQIETARHLLNRELSEDHIDETRVNDLTRLLIDLNASFVDLIRNVVKNGGLK